MSYRGLSFKVSSGDQIKLDIMEDSWPVENRPEKLRRVKALLSLTVDGFLKLKKQIEKEEERKNLGEEACAKDGLTRTVRYKTKRDDGKKKLHLARWSRWYRQRNSTPKSLKNVKPSYAISPWNTTGSPARYRTWC
jgi:hypothetical protein